MPQNRNYSEETTHKIDIAVRASVDQALECATSTLQNNRALLDQTAEELLKTETLNQPDIIKLKEMITASMSQTRNERYDSVKKRL